MNGADNAGSLERNGKSTVWNVLLILLLILLILCAGAYYTCMDRFIIDQEIYFLVRLKMSKSRKVLEKLHKQICMEII